MKKNKGIKITISGCGYVGRGNAIFLSEFFNVSVYDINRDAIESLNVGEIEKIYEKEKAYIESDYIFLCLPTDSKDGRLDTTILENEIKKIKEINNDCMVVIKSTCPVGFTEKMISETGMKIIFYPEFLREGKEVEDIKNPDRVIIGTEIVDDFPFVKMYNNVFFCTPSEAEAIKLFSNTYLALRVAFFNELDNYCISKNLDAGNIIEGVCQDKRIGNYYNNPSFGFGGYCLPKDSKEIAGIIPENVLINNINISNENRKKFIADDIKKKYSGEKISVNNYAMKKGSDNSRCSAMFGVIENLKCENIVDNINEADVILCNRYDSEIKNKKIYTRDIFGRD